MDQIHHAEKVAIGLISSFTIIHAAFKTWNFCTKNDSSILRARTVSWFIVYCIQTVSNYILLVSTIMCLYMFIVYKGQTVQYVSLPDEHNEATIKILTFVAFAAKIVEMISLIHQHRGVNIFFIDWEQPQKMLNPELIYESSRLNCKRIQIRQNSQLLSKSCDNDNIFNCDSHDGDSEYGQKKFSTCIDINNVAYDFTSNWSSVSTWRVCFIANHWLRIKTKRKTSVIFQMLATLFILEIAGLKFWSLAQPKWSLTNEPSSRIQENFTFANAVATGLFTFVYSLQWLACTLYEIYVKNFLQEFVELCSIANISIFILSHDYLGYYIHGRSVNGFADKNLASLINDLESEEINQCAHRGLVPGTHEQMFIVAVSNTFRTCYDAILKNEGSQSENIKFTRPNLFNDRFWNEQWKTRTKMHKFFRDYLDHNLKHVDYTVQEKYFLEKLCNIELANTSEKSIFYIDKNYSFDASMFHGNEFVLATFELVTFLFVLALGGNWITGALVTVSMSELVSFAVQVDQKKQLAVKTLIDRRFLV